MTTFIPLVIGLTLDKFNQLSDCFIVKPGDTGL